MERYWEHIRRKLIPTSNEAQLYSLKALLGHFCTNDQIEYKSAKLSNGTLNYIEIVRKPEDFTSRLTGGHQKHTLLLMHGFGSGLGFFFSNYDYFANSFDRVIAVDWLGMGGSSRESPPTFTPICDNNDGATYYLGLMPSCSVLMHRVLNFHP